MSLSRLILAAPMAALALALVLKETAMAADPAAQLARSVSVSASGAASAEPDAAAFQTGVVTEAATAREALSANSAAVGKIIDGLKVAGVAAKDIQTSALHINPRYQQNKGEGAQRIAGYTAQNQVRVAVRDLKRLGELLDLAIGLGANQMHGITFEVSAAETLRDEARKAAMVNARRRAELYAAAAGASLGQVVTISESIAMSGPRPMAVMRSSMAAESVPVEAGSQRLEATVHVTWELK